jgi:hypothetical protein
MSHFQIFSELLHLIQRNGGLNSAKNYRDFYNCCFIISIIIIREDIN